MFVKILQKPELNARKILNDLKKNIKHYYKTDPVDFNQKKKEDKWTKNMMHSNFSIGKNIWILKPTMLNRGIGIHLFTEILEL